MEILIQALQLILSLSILIVLHELGHFIPAKLFKTRVEKFYLFFNPWFSLFKKKVGETEYGVGWLPLGGYVKISGMIDESVDKEQMKSPPKKWEFRSKPAWQRLIIMLGGVFVNFLLGIFIYSMVLFVYGESYLPNKSLIDGVMVGDSLKDLPDGFQTGDKIIDINGVAVDRFSYVVENLPLAKTVTVQRGDNRKKIDIPSDFLEGVIEKVKESGAPFLVYPRIPIIVDSVYLGDGYFNSAFLQKNDQIVSLNNSKIAYYDQLEESIASINKEWKDTATNAEVWNGLETSIGVLRDGRLINSVVKINNEYQIGFLPKMLSFKELDEMGVYKLEKLEFGFFESFGAGYNKAVYKLGWYVDQFMLILNPSSGAYKGLGGFKAIGSLFPNYWSWEVFWNWTAFLSLMLAFMNLLPIPALDGGHVVFLIYEIIVGKPAPEKTMEYAQMVGMIFLLFLLVYANGNDFGLWDWLN